MEKLSIRELFALMLRLNGFSDRDIAILIGMKEDLVSPILSKARKKLKNIKNI